MMKEDNLRFFDNSGFWNEPHSAMLTWDNLTYPYLGIAFKNEELNILINNQKKTK